MRCKVCYAKKHFVKWGESRQNERDSTVHTRGGLCYAGVRAALWFGLRCRSHEIFAQVPTSQDVSAGTLSLCQDIEKYDIDRFRCLRHSYLSISVAQKANP